jgi:hypothetical protein
LTTEKENIEASYLDIERRKWLSQQEVHNTQSMPSTVSVRSHKMATPRSGDMFLEVGITETKEARNAERNV